jgi:transcriptional regulator with XRE-family HTH domain
VQGAPDLTVLIAEHIAERIRQRRRQLGMTTAQLAAQIGITRENATRLQSGRHLPRLDTLVRVCQALGLRVSALLRPLDQIQKE